MDIHKNSEKRPKKSKNIIVAYISLLLGGFFGAHQFYLGRWKSGLGMVFLFAAAFIYQFLLYGWNEFYFYNFPLWLFRLLQQAFLVWLFSDIILTRSRVNAYNERAFEKNRQDKPHPVTKMTFVVSVLGKFSRFLLCGFAIFIQIVLIFLLQFSVYQDFMNDGRTLRTIQRLAGIDARPILSDPAKMAIAMIEQNTIENKPENKTAATTNSGKKKLKTYKGKLGRYKIALDENKWDFQKRVTDEYTEFFWSLKKNDAGAFIYIDDRDETLSMAEFKALMLERLQWRSEARIKILKDTTNIVNGKNVLQIDFLSKEQGNIYVYRGMFWVGTKGSVQMVTYAPLENYDKVAADIDDFLAGVEF